ncbi:hypothetical protein [Spiroplasma poulsonii]|uniref:hypothetical protein n=1 Tax=Spiroplasma poulsonii TaxID=2138 RepID=UPI001F4C592E|nr:hypothetical protein [Spiroplasma poulsonii]UNF61537.1 hypothetical protein MNU24_06375 [Spiroplasma poulsonii]
MIILMIKYYYWCYRNSNPTLKKNKTILFLVKKKHTIKTQVIIRQGNQKKLLQQVFARKKHDYALFKESKIPILKIPN